MNGVAGWFEGLGLRPGLFWALVASAAEAGGGLLMVVGLGGPLGPGILAGDLVVVTLVAHTAPGFWASAGKVGWEFLVPLAAAGFAIALQGNGAWSIDGLLGLTYSEAFRWIRLAVDRGRGRVALVETAVLAPKKVAAEEPFTQGCRERPRVPRPSSSGSGPCAGATPDPADVPRGRRKGPPLGPAPR